MPIPAESAAVTIDPLVPCVDNTVPVDPIVRTKIFTFKVVGVAVGRVNCGPKTNVDPVGTVKDTECVFGVAALSFPDTVSVPAVPIEQTIYLLLVPTVYWTTNVVQLLVFALSTAWTKFVPPESVVKTASLSAPYPVRVKYCPSVGFDVDKDEYANDGGPLTVNVFVAVAEL